MQDNQITIVGNMVTEPEHRTLSSGAELTRFRVASTLRRVDPDTRQWYDAATTFLRVTCWRRLAVHTAATLRKGDPVVVMGRVATKTWDRDGQTHTTQEVEASLVALDLTRVAADVRRARRDDVAAADPWSAAPAGVDPATGELTGPPVGAAALTGGEPVGAPAEPVAAPAGVADAEPATAAA